MIRVIAILSGLSILMFAPFRLLAAGSITAPKVTVGKELEMWTSVRLTKGAPPDGLELTLTSDDPARLLLSTAPEKRGAASIRLKVLPRFPESPDFWVQGLADSGAVSYTVSAAGFESAKGTVTFTPSAIVIIGPFKAPKYPTTPRGEPAKISIISAALDASLKVAGEQQIAGGLRADVTITNSNSTVGKLGSSKLTLSGGSSRAVTYFQPAAEGETTITPVQPSGFTVPREYPTVVMAVAKPGLGIVGDMYLGKNLQITAGLALGESAPPGGLSVTLRSRDASKLVISTKEDQLGSASATVFIPAGQQTAQYYLQGLSDSGEVTYEATAPGFRSRAARIGLAPSTVIVAYERYGPPDEASVLRKQETEDERPFAVSLSVAKEHPVHVVAWMAYLDPRNGRAADITVQPLRPGVNATVALTSSDPAVGTVESPMVIKSGANHVVSRFTPLKKGTTVISVNKTAGFALSKNATSVPATVVD